MDRITEKILQTIEEYEMLLPDEHVIAGVSGGADSVCLLYILKAWQQTHPCKITVVHVEHGIRGRASQMDAEWVEELCREWNIPCELRHIDARLLARDTGQTLEEAGRQARYDIFERIRRELGADRIAVAHNENDQAETVLMNLIRGSGLRGLGGILPVRERIIRPLLFTSRQEIEALLKRENISYRTDQTNFETEYTRNKMRLQILPALKEINPRAVEHIAESAQQLQKAELFLQEQTDRLYRSCVRPEEEEICLELTEFLRAEEQLQEYVLRRCIETLQKGRGLKDFTRVHIGQLKRLAAMPCGKQMDFPGGMEAVRLRENELVFRKREKAAKGADRGADRRADRGADRRADRGAGRGADGAGSAAGEAGCRILAEGTYKIANHKFEVSYL
ncbi:MAG: tRNA lysidine(34) synthetase TilS, partial [Lachnospiraceae bacterium]|nr:tRNA lysidine(34) synthetase TilS [Lachnospiraceae bacterium]